MSSVDGLEAFRFRDAFRNFELAPYKIANSIEKASRFRDALRKFPATPGSDWLHTKPYAFPAAVASSCATAGD